MNTNEVSPKANDRMNRIQKISKCVRLILQCGIPSWLIAYLTLIMLTDHYRIRFPFLSYAANPKAQPGSYVTHTDMTIIIIYSCVGLVIFLFWYRAVLKLFGFFEKGILFTAETVHCIQFLGAIYILKFLLALIFHLLVPYLESHFMGDFMADLFTGFFIIFIGWLIDEARKIREEQELTV